ncbi:hypothetical protein EYZ11_007253 [Aspergillus tanneri]|uniref:Carrier domain-containing protein n=1 Tax=Aspergillus tanneri TaxID=1220188 RepID=A0A4S3JFQ1_9EURO|nr:hypothetical protein EYZ11_007253 [Aspergillus tanneri]
MQTNTCTLTASEPITRCEAVDHFNDSNNSIKNSLINLGIDSMTAIAIHSWLKANSELDVSLSLDELGVDSMAAVAMYSWLRTNHIMEAGIDSVDISIQEIMS